MNSSELEYKINEASAEEICTHLQQCSQNFRPPLADRVNIGVYSKKIAEQSVSFEAWHKNLLVGLIAAYFNEDTSHPVFITNVSVLDTFMKSGIASELLSRCIGHAQQHNFREIQLEVFKDNLVAINFYKKLNFIPCGTNNNFIVMKIDLNKPV